MIRVGFRGRLVNASDDAAWMPRISLVDSWVGEDVVEAGGELCGFEPDAEEDPVGVTSGEG